MRSSILRKEMPLIAILLFFTFALALAADNNIKRTRGKVETVNLNKKFFILNESEYFWNHDTIFVDEKGTTVKIDQLIPKASVYVEWESVKGTRKRIPKKVCIFKEKE
jgi:hypothetical protein